MSWITLLMFVFEVAVLHLSIVSFPLCSTDLLLPLDWLQWIQITCCRWGDSLSKSSRRRSVRMWRRPPVEVYKRWEHSYSDFWFCPWHCRLLKLCWDFFVVLVLSSWMILWPSKVTFHRGYLHQGRKSIAASSLAPAGYFGFLTGPGGTGAPLYTFSLFPFNFIWD